MNQVPNDANQADNPPTEANEETTQSQRVDQAGQPADATISQDRGGEAPSDDAPLGGAITPEHWAQMHRQFCTQLQIIHNVMKQPLPPALTGIASAAFDPTATTWADLELSDRPGVILLGGRVIDLLKFYAAVMRLGGHSVVTARDFWPRMADYYGVPADQASDPPVPNGLRLRRLYDRLLKPVEEQRVRSRGPLAYPARAAAGASATPAEATRQK